MITITSKIDGFRRAGVAHPDEATEYPNDAFTKQQLAQLQAEPMLVVVESPEPDAGKGKKEKKPREGGDAPPQDREGAPAQGGEQS